MEKGMEKGLERGIEKGIELGEQRMSILIQKLIEVSRKDEIERAVTDKEYQELLYKEFDL